MPAAAARLFVRIHEFESLAHELLLPIEHRTREVEQGLLVDDELNPVLLENAVPIARRLSSI